MKAKFLSPFTDFGFKKLYGEEASKDLLMDFLNQFLPEHHRIRALNFRNSGQLGMSDWERRAIFDIYCESQTSEKFIVELQKAKQNYFKDRTAYYSIFPIKEQAEKGDWNFKLKAVYCVGILDFVFDDTENIGEYLHTVKLKDQNNAVFYDKLTILYIEMPNFKKTENELTDKKEKWLYFLKNLEDMDHIPAILDEEVFATAFQKAELSKLNAHEIEKYEESLKVYRDLNNVIDTARFEGFEEGKIKGKLQGKIEGKFEIARALKADGLSISKIAVFTGFSADVIKDL
jgi:predicted transposase/invertase (TIGR01784 family)